MRINENHGIVVGEGGRIQGGARVSNIQHREKQTMNNTFQGHVGVVAESAHDFTQVQNNAALGVPDLKQLAEQLSQVRAQARQEATLPEHDIAMGEMALAESAAKKEDAHGAFQHLAKAGQWALDVATKIGASVAAEAIKKALFP